MHKVQTHSSHLQLHHLSQVVPANTSARLLTTGKKDIANGALSGHALIMTAGK